MSAEGNEISSHIATTGCPVNMVAFTQALDSHRVKWTVEKLSNGLEYEEIKGPTFFFKGINFDLSMKKYYNGIDIFLENDSRKSIEIGWLLVLLDCEGKELGKYNRNSIPLDGKEKYCFNESLRTVYEIPFESLKNGSLIIDCSLFLINRITTKIGSFQSQKKSMENLFIDFKMLYEKSEHSDFMIEVGDDFIPAHKAILSLRSPYFKALLEANMKERKDNSVVIKDTSYKTMKQVLEFLYTGHSTIKEEDDKVQESMDLYTAADKYEVMDLRSSCAEQLIAAATVENILEILQLPGSYSDDQLKTEALHLIHFRYGKLLKSNDWKTFVENNPNLAVEVMEFSFQS